MYWKFSMLSLTSMSKAMSKGASLGLRRIATSCSTPSSTTMKSSEERSATGKPFPSSTDTGRIIRSTRAPNWAS